MSHTIAPEIKVYMAVFLQENKYAPNGYSFSVTAFQQEEAPEFEWVQMVFSNQTLLEIKEVYLPLSAFNPYEALLSGFDRQEGVLRQKYMEEQEKVEEAKTRLLSLANPNKEPEYEYEAVRVKSESRSDWDFDPEVPF